MPQLTLFGKPAAQPTAAPAPPAKKMPASKAQTAAPKVSKGKAKASSSSGVRAEESTAELDSAARAQAVWAAHRASQVTGISAQPLPPQPPPPQAAARGMEAVGQERLLGTAAPSAGGSTTLERMQAQERLLVEQHAAARGRPVAPKKASREAGWRRTGDGERAFVTASGKRLTGKVAHAAAKRLKP